MVIAINKYIILISQVFHVNSTPIGNHKWIPRVELAQLEGELKDKPRICPKCKSAYWDLEKKNGVKK